MLGKIKLLRVHPNRQSHFCVINKIKYKMNDYTNHYRLNKVRDSVPNSCAHKQSYETEKCTANKRNKKGAMWMYSFMITYSCLPFIIFMLCFNFSMFTQNYGYFYKIVTILWPPLQELHQSLARVYIYIYIYIWTTSMWEIIIKSGTFKVCSNIKNTSLFLKSYHGF